MTTLNNQDEIYRFNTQKPIADLHDRDLKQKDFREILLGAKEEDAEQDLWLKLKDEDFTWNNLYLGRSKTFKKGTAPQKHNIVVPIIPRCYATADRDPARAVEVPEGWLYIIRQFDAPQGTVVELWRELKSDGLGNFSDVNLKQYKGKDRRKATGQPGFRVIVPYCIDKKDHQTWMAYSEVQWSWARVQSMKQDSKLRGQRMHKLDLSDCLNDFAESNYSAPPSPQKSNENQDKLEIKNVSGTALLYNLKSAPDPESRDLANDFKEAIPVVYLDNPVGIGRSLAGEYQQQWQELTDCLSDLRAMPGKVMKLEEQYGSITPGSPTAGLVAKSYGPARWFEAAALTNRYFFSKISKQIPPGVKDKDAYRKRLAEIEEQFIQYQGKLDKPAIEQALWVPQRTEIRQKLVRAREDLVDFLEKELAAIKPEQSGEEAKDPPLVLALDDYFTLTPLGDRERKQNSTDAVGDKSTPRWRDNYLDGWQAVYDILAGLAKHEYSLDADLEANPPDGWQWRRDNRAFELLLKLADPQGGNPLHSRLFPKAAADNPLKIDAVPVEDTAAAFKKQHLDNLEPLILRDPDIVCGLALFGSNFSELMAMGDKKDPAYEQRLERARHSILRLVDSVFGLQLEQTEVSLAELIANAKKQAEAGKNGRLTVYAAFVKSVGFMGSTIKTANSFPTAADPGDGPLGRIRERVIIAVNNTRTLKLLRDLGDEKAITSGIAGFLGLVKIHNFTKALKAFAGNKNDDRNWELFAPLAARFLQLPAAIMDVKGSVEALAKAGQGGGRAATQGARKSGVEIGSDIAAGAKAAKIIKTLGIFGNLLDMGVTLSSLTENLAQNDDAAIADAIGFTGAVLGLIAMAFSITVLGWVAGLVGLAAWLAKAYLFTEDTPVEIWLANCPFVRGNEYHEAFRYKRSTTIKKVKDAKGNWVDTGCIVHRYDNFEFLVDSGGTLVHAGPSQFQSPVQCCKVEPDGAVYLKARKWYDLRTNKWHEIPPDTHVATIGQPFTMHPLLKTTENEKPKEKPQHKPAEKTVHDVRSCHKGMATFKKTPLEKWQANPHQAYLALADAIYRPRVTLTDTGSPPGDSQCALKVKLPFYLPGKSKLHIEFEQKDDQQYAVLSRQDPDSIKSLEVGPGEYELIRQFPFWESKSFTAKVRLDLYGDGEVQLPNDPLFCGPDIETKIDEHTRKGVQSQTETKWIVVQNTVPGKKLRGTIGDVVGDLIDDLKHVAFGGSQANAIDKP
jgi:hypothetical protein